jgi:hypothetical protein
MIGSGANQIRKSHQHENSEDSRPDSTAGSARRRGRGDRIVHSMSAFDPKRTLSLTALSDRQVTKLKLPPAVPAAPAVTPTVTTTATVQASPAVTPAASPLHVTAVNLHGDFREPHLGSDLLVHKSCRNKRHDLSLAWREALEIGAQPGP